MCVCERERERERERGSERERQCIYIVPLDVRIGVVAVDF